MSIPESQSAFLNDSARYAIERIMEKTLKVVGELKKRKGSPGSMKSRNPTEESSSESSRDTASSIDIGSSWRKILGRHSPLKKIIEAKARRRKDLAKLPFEEKIRILVRLQEMAGGIRKPGKPQTKGVWQI